MPATWRRSVAQAAALGGALLFAGLALLFWFLFLDLYWQHRNAFDAEGRLFLAAEGVVRHEQTAWLALPALLCTGVSVGCAWLWHRRRTRRSAPAG